MLLAYTEHELTTFFSIFTLFPLHQYLFYMEKKYIFWHLVMIGCDWTSTLMCFSRILRHELNEIECLFFYIYSMKHMVIFLSCSTLWSELANFVQKYVVIFSSFFKKRLMNDWNRKWKSIWGWNWQNASLYDSLIKLSHILNGFSEQKRPNTFWTISYKNGHATRVRKIPIAQSDQTSFGFTTMGLNINWKNIFLFFIHWFLRSLPKSV